MAQRQIGDGEVALVLSGSEYPARGPEESAIGADIVNLDRSSPALQTAGMSRRLAWVHVVE